jgi:GNAT superfamily N-acetyltransferase
MAASADGAGPPAPLHVRRPSSRELPDLFPQLAELYAAVYAEPPYREGPDDVAAFAARLPEEVQRPGFALVGAFAGDRLGGVAYGWPLPSGEWFGGTVEEPPAAVRQLAKFVVMEWQVLAAYRNAGVGRALISALLADRPEPVAILAADPRAAARAVYARAGWQRCGALALPTGAVMDVLFLTL